MDALQFCYWLQGYFELNGNNEFESLDHHQVNIIKDHLKLVFNKVTPDRSKEILPRMNPWPSCGPVTIPTLDQYMSTCASNRDRLVSHYATGVGPNFEYLQYYPGVSC